MDAPFADISDPLPGSNRPRKRAMLHEHRMLTGSLLGLLATVGTLMCFSLVSCESAPKTTTSTTNKPAVVSKEERETLSKVPAAPLAGITAEPEVRVRLASAVGEIELSGYQPGGKSKSGGPVYVGPIGGQTGPMMMPGPVKLKMNNQGWLLTDAGGKSLRLEKPSELVVTADPAEWTMVEGAPGSRSGVTGTGALITVNGSPYPGRMWLVPRSDVAGAAFDVIEHVGLESYLVGVVVKEMYNSWPKEAFKVQAVCARSYALHERQRALKTKRPFDIESSTRDQAYAGVSSNPNAIEAVAATRGVVLGFGGEVLRAYYSSTCGGRTANAKDTWPTTAGYEYNLAAPIQAHERAFACNDSPTFVWTVSRNADELTKRLKAWGDVNGYQIRQIAGIAGLEPLEFASTGRPSVYKVIEPGGKWYRIKAEELRVACNYAAQGLPAITGKDRVNSGDMAWRVTPGVAGKRGSGGGGAPARVEITGHGFGHGVGMCQYCARAMALKGEEWRKMVMMFYPGAEVVKAY